MNSYMILKGIIYENSGIILRQFVEGKAKAILDGRFRNIMSPDPEEIKRVLVSHFGRRKYILKSILS